MKSKNLLFFILTFILISSAIIEAAGRISGKVKDEDNFSLAGANVFIQSLGLGTATDQNGEFLLLNVPEGNYDLTVSFLGYSKETINLKVEENKTTSINVVLKAGVVVGNEVLVLGDQLKGQAKALNQQRNNSNITNVVSSDQIGRFPDANVGDALKRIPAITVNYDQGEARFVNIRGTEPRLNSVMLNGDRVPSAEAEIRNVQVDLIPSDMIQTIEVNKALTPDMDADAIGGAINLITRPAPNNLRISGTIGSGYNALRGNALYNGSFVVGSRFADYKLGAVISGSYNDNDFGSDNTEGVWTGDAGNYYPEEWDVRKYNVRRLRQSVSGAFDYKLDAFNTIFFNAIYNHRNDWENRFRLRYILDEPNEDGVVEEGQIRRQTKGGSADNDNRRLEDQRTWRTGLSGDHLLGNVKLDWGFSFAKASEERPNERYMQFRVRDIPISVNSSDIREPQFSENVALEDYELHELTEQYQYTDEKDFNAKVNFEIPFLINKNLRSSLQLGGKYKKKDKKRDNELFEYEPLDGFENLTDVPTEDFTDSDFEAGNYKVGRMGTSEFLGSLDLNNAALFEKSEDISEKAGNFNATEKVLAGYAQFKHEFSEKLSMIAGLRLERTEIEYGGFEFDEEEETLTPTSGSDDYTNILPGVHFKYNVSDNTILRFAWTNTISRPNYFSLVPYRNIAEDNEELSIGNPALEPTTSMNFDLMAENYFESVGILSAGVFYKKINDFIYTQKIENYSDPVSGNTYDDFFQPRNGAEATLLGFEFAIQRRLDFFEGFLRNLTFYANYTFTSSSADNPQINESKGSDETIDLPGTSPHTLNTALMYEDSKISLGVSFNYSDSYIDPDELDFTPGLERYYDAVTYLDITGSYKFTDQFRFFFEANNLLNQPLRYYAGEKDRTYQAEYYDRKFTAGLKFDL